MIQRVSVASVPAIAVGRTLADYGSARDFYIGDTGVVPDDGKLAISDAAAPALGTS